MPSSTGSCRATKATYSGSSKAQLKTLTMVGAKKRATAMKLTSENIDASSQASVNVVLFRVRNASYASSKMPGVGI